MTPGLAANPCRDCPQGLQASTSLNSSAAYWASDGAGKQGFTNQLACVTIAGWGYNGRIASKVTTDNRNTCRAMSVHAQSQTRAAHSAWICDGGQMQAKHHAVRFLPAVPRWIVQPSWLLWPMHQVPWGWPDHREQCKPPSVRG